MSSDLCHATQHGHVKRKTFLKVKKLSFSRFGDQLPALSFREGKATLARAPSTPEAAQRGLLCDPGMPVKPCLQKKNLKDDKNANTTVFP